ncbi:MAG: DEAD/DEAH box helicase, partial [Gemmatimonadetes bacterium]|nr:DEAD/DEAH box helicase [Gemmatimonadota bacterium]
MQEALLHSERFVRLVSAPTGSGKSYAFMRAVLDEGAQVLFIVPTKRLLQNLIGEAREQACERLRGRGVSEAQCADWLDEHVIEWSGNQVGDGRESLALARVRQLLEGGGGSEGKVIFAIPEVVVRLISGIRLTGASAINPFLYVRRFDHIVFDEFHTIDDRAFGLACLLSLLAVREQQCKVSLLSATPIDVTGVLAQAGVGRSEIEMISEEIADGHPPGHRPIHGDVLLSTDAGSLLDVVKRNTEAVQDSIVDGRTVIVIYDSLQRLKQDELEVRGVLSKAGINDERILAVNSIDDSRRVPGEPHRGKRYEDPHSFDALLCTSTVEVGVTFRSTLMFMEPGFGPASFVQRIGRVSRGADNGRVVVSLPERTQGRLAWIRPVRDIVDASAQLAVQDFSDQILRAAKQQFEPSRKEADADFSTPGATIRYYRRASWRGALWAA